MKRADSGPPMSTRPPLSNQACASSLPVSAFATPSRSVASCPSDSRECLQRERLGQASGAQPSPHGRDAPGELVRRRARPAGCSRPPRRERADATPRKHRQRDAEAGDREQRANEETAPGRRHAGKAADRAHSTTATRPVSSSSASSASTSASHRVGSTSYSSTSASRSEATLLGSWIRLHTRAPTASSP